MKRNKIRNAIYTVLGMLVVVATIAFAIWLIREILNWFNSADVSSRNSALGLTGVISVPVITFFTQRWLNKYQSKEQAIKEKRIAFYTHLINFIRLSLSNSNKNTQIRQKPAAQTSNTSRNEQQFMQLKGEMLAYASENFIKAWDLFQNVSIQNPDDSSQQGTEDHSYLILAAAERMFIAMRKDIGQKTSSSNFGENVQIFVPDIDKAKLNSANQILNAY